ncbi:MAG: cyclase family protein [Bacillota bacterium]
MIYDVSMLIHPSMQVYKNKEEKKPRFETIASHPNDGAHETNVTMNLHTGTHIDYPLHMIENGKTSDNEILDTLIGPCKVIDLTSVKHNISKFDLEPYTITDNDFLLLKTRNSFSDVFLSDFVYLDESGARYLNSKNIRGVGIDGLGIERAQPAHPTHKILLSEDIIIIEGLRLKDIREGTYELYCLPLKIQGVEAVPARVILKD